MDNITPATVAASLSLSEDRKAIIWTIGIECMVLSHTQIWYCAHIHTGQKFPGKSLEVSLQATVHFHENPMLSSSDDPFCTGLNAYIDVS